MPSSLSAALACLPLLLVFAMTAPAVPSLRLPLEPCKCPACVHGSQAEEEEESSESSSSPCPSCLSSIPYDFLADLRIVLAEGHVGLFDHSLVELMLDSGLQHCPHPLLERSDARSLDRLACILQFYVSHATSLSERWEPALAKMRLVMEAESKRRGWEQLYSLGPKVLDELDKLVRRLREQNKTQ